MPTLKGLSCFVEAGDPQHHHALQEYGTFYSDGFVETFIAVPVEPQSFAIRLKSDTYIADGLAMYVFIDGEYQCNRNRQGLQGRDSKKTPPDRRNAVDFCVRQKEQNLKDGNMISRGWTFEKLNIGNFISLYPSCLSLTSPVTADEAPSKCSPELMKNIGCIEVVVLRCKGYRSPSATKSVPDRNAGLDGANDGPDHFYGFDGHRSEWNYDNRAWQMAAPSTHPQSRLGPTLEPSRPPSGFSYAQHAEKQHTRRGPAPSQPAVSRAPSVGSHHRPSTFTYGNGPIPGVTYGSGPTPPNPPRESEFELFDDRTPSDMSVQELVDPAFLKRITQDAYRRGLEEAEQKLRKEQNHGVNSVRASGHGENNTVRQPPGAWPPPPPPPPYEPPNTYPVAPTLNPYGAHSEPSFMSPWMPTEIKSNSWDRPEPAKAQTEDHHGWENGGDGWSQHLSADSWPTFEGNNKHEWSQVSNAGIRPASHENSKHEWSQVSGAGGPPTSRGNHKLDSDSWTSSTWGTRSTNEYPGSGTHRNGSNRPRSQNNHSSAIAAPVPSVKARSEKNHSGSNSTRTSKKSHNGWPAPTENTGWDAKSRHSWGRDEADSAGDWSSDSNTVLESPRMVISRSRKRPSGDQDSKFESNGGPVGGKHLWNDNPGVARSASSESAPWPPSASQVGFRQTPSVVSGSTTANSRKNAPLPTPLSLPDPFSSARSPPPPYCVSKGELFRSMPRGRQNSPIWDDPQTDKRSARRGSAAQHAGGLTRSRTEVDNWGQHVSTSKQEYQNVGRNKGNGSQSGSFAWDNNEPKDSIKNQAQAQASGDWNQGDWNQDNGSWNNTTPNEQNHDSWTTNDNATAEKHTMPGSWDNGDDDAWRNGESPTPGWADNKNDSTEKVVQESSWDNNDWGEQTKAAENVVDGGDDWNNTDWGEQKNAAEDTVNGGDNDLNNKYVTSKDQKMENGGRLVVHGGLDSNNDPDKKDSSGYRDQWGSGAWDTLNDTSDSKDENPGATDWAPGFDVPDDSKDKQDNAQDEANQRTNDTNNEQPDTFWNAGWDNNAGDTNDKSAEPDTSWNNDWNNKTDDTKEQSANPETSFGNDWQNNTGGSNWQNNTGDTKVQSVKGDPSSGNDWNKTTGDADKKSAKSDTKSSRGRLHAYRRLRNPGPLTPQHWSFPAAPLPKKLYPIPEDYESTTTSQARKPRILTEEPVRSVPEGKAKDEGLERGVRTGKGEAYHHAVSRPRYMDSMDRPYAVFRFKYRTRDYLKGLLGDEVPDVESEPAPVEDPESVVEEKVKSMTPDQMKDEIIRLSRQLHLGESKSEIATLVKNWVGDQQERSKKGVSRPASVHGSKKSNRAGGSQKPAEEKAAGGANDDWANAGWPVDVGGEKVASNNVGDAGSQKPAEEKAAGGANNDGGDGGWQQDGEWKQDEGEEKEGGGDWGGNPFG
jgi:hypothetical protein